MTSHNAEKNSLSSSLSLSLSPVSLYRCVLLFCAAVLCLICLLSIHLPLMETDEAVTWHVSPQHKKVTPTDLTLFV